MAIRLLLLMGFAARLVASQATTWPYIFPPNSSPEFACNYSVWDYFYLSPPDQWGPVLQQNPLLTPSTSAPVQCRHCWWNLGYPVANPFVFVFALNCTQFVEYLYIDPTWWGGVNPISGNMTISSFQAMFLGYSDNQVLPTGFMTEQGRIDPAIVAQDVDLNQDGVIGLNEFQVAMHFFAPLVWSQAGPTLFPGMSQILGGYFFDLTSWQIWLSQSETTVQSNPLYFVNGVADSWLLNLRAASQSEAALSFSQCDIDFSGRYSIHEHYFRLWADQNQNGVVEPAEFALSLWSVSTSLTTPAPGNSTFAIHDIDKDGLITFSERKFFVADLNHDFLLSKTEWTQEDHNINDFASNDIDSSGTISVPEYILYSALTQCTSGSTSSGVFSWDSSLCNLQVVLYGLPLFNDSNAFLWRDIQNLLNINAAPIQVLSSMTAVSAALVAAGQNNVTTKNFNNITLAIVTTADPTISNTFVCSNSMNGFDGLYVLVLTNPPVISLEALIPSLLISPSFLQFMCVVFIAVLVTGHVFYITERHKNQEQFSPVYVAGVLDGFYYSIVTLLTIGYGDKVPSTGAGKTFGIIWMFIGVIVFSIFSGEITSNLAAEAASNLIASSSDLTGMNVGVLPQNIGGGDISTQYAFVPVLFPTMEAAGASLLQFKINAIVAPAPIIITYLNEYAAAGNCLSDFSIAGTLFQPRPMNMICTSNATGYAANYLINGINSAFAQLVANGQYLVDSANVSITSQPTGQSCSVANPYPVTLLIVVGSIIVVLTAIAIVYKVFAKKRKDRIRDGKAMEIMQRIHVYQQDRVKRFAQHWLRKTRERRARRDAMAKLDEIRRVLAVAKADQPNARVTPEDLRIVAHNMGLNQDPRPIEVVEREISYPFLSRKNISPDPLLAIMHDVRANLQEMKTALSNLSTKVAERQAVALGYRYQIEQVVMFFSVVTSVIFVVLIVAIAELLVHYVQNS